jgi:DNA-binding transcriptional LysR family regulator
VDDRRLQTFVVVAEELNFTRAAERLHVTQSTVSATIRALEHEIGTPLLARTTRSVALTSAGLSLLPEAKAALIALDRARSVASGDGELRGSLTLGTLGGLQSVDLPALAGSFQRQHPQVDMRVEISPRGTSGLLERLRSGHLDLAVLGEAQREQDLISWPIRTFELAVFVPAGHALADRDEVGLADLVSSSFVEQPLGFWQRTVVDAAFAARGLRRRITMEVMDLRSMPAFVAHGLGVAILPRSLLTPDLTDLRTVALSDGGLDWTVSLAASARRPVSRAAATLIELLPDFVDPTASF